MLTHFHQGLLRIVQNQASGIGTTFLCWTTPSIMPSQQAPAGTSFHGAGLWVCRHSGLHQAPCHATKPWPYHFLNLRLVSGGGSRGVRGSCVPQPRLKERREWVSGLPQLRSLGKKNPQLHLVEVVGSSTKVKWLQREVSPNRKHY